MMRLSLRAMVLIMAILTTLTLAGLAVLQTLE